MTGQRKRAGRGPRQPGGRPPAPGELALVQAFVNTHFDLGADYGSELLASPAALRRWLADQGLLAARGREDALGPSELTAALALRESLRALGATHSPAGALDRLALSHPVQLRFAPTGAQLAPNPGQDPFSAALGRLLAITAAAMLDGRWSRIKVCPGHHCGWMFYDRSRNRSGRWCAMSVCGGRHKARAHYERTRGS